jgi:hypothetical protein
MILNLKPEIELIPHDDGWTYNLITEQGTRSVNFKSGQIVDYVSLIGRPVKVTMNMYYSCLMYQIKTLRTSGVTICDVICAVNQTKSINQLKCSYFRHLVHNDDTK